MSLDTSIAFDGSCLGGARPTGVERSFLHTLAAFRRANTSARLLLYVPRDLHASIRSGGDVAIPPGVEVRTIPAGVPTALWRELRLARELEREGVGALWTPTTALPKRAPCRTVATVHEIPPRELEDSATRAWRQARARLALRARAEIVVVPSQHTRRQLLRESPSLEAKMHVVPQPLAPCFRALERPREHGRGLLYVGAARRRKNLARIARAWTRLPRELRAQHPFTWIGTGASPLAERAGIRVAGPLSDRELVAQIRAHRALVLASTSEGFGIPALEALACGRTPIVAGDSAPAEICAPHAVLCKPHDEASIARAMQRALRDDALAARSAELGPRHSARYTPEATARAWREILQSHQAASAEA